MENFFFINLCKFLLTIFGLHGIINTTKDILKGVDFMRKILLVVLCVLLLITTVACGNKTNNKTDVAVDTAGNIVGSTTAEIVSDDNVEDVLEEFKDSVGEFELPIEEELSFYVENEENSWNNSMTVRQDGSFYGSYYKLDDNLTGESYQNGTYYWNEYWGEFTDILWLDEYTFSMKMTSLATEHDSGIERLEDDSFKSATTLDIDGTTKDVEYILFMPNTPMNMLPENIEELLNKDLSNQDSLGMYVLLNTESQIAFYCEL